jgi:hypothetical protein
MGRSFISVLLTIFAVTTAVSAYANGVVFEAVWSGGAKASFSLKAGNIITYCFNDEPCSDYRYKGNADRFSITFPKYGDYAGGYMELRKNHNRRYSAEFYYGEEASLKIGTKSVAEFQSN